MEKESEKRYQEFISASKEVDDIYHTLALKFGLSDSAMWILCTMREADRELTQAEIAEEMSMSRQTINSAIKNLEKQGYLYMAPAPGDRRNKTLSFTAKGEDFVKRTVDRMLDLEHQVFARLEVQEQEQITEILRKYTRYMKEGAEKI